MEYKKRKSVKQKLEEDGLPINYVSIKGEIYQKSKGLKPKKIGTFYTEIVYKQIYPDIHKDKYTIDRLQRRLDITEKQSIKVIKIEILKNLGNGVYEQAKV